MRVLSWVLALALLVVSGTAMAGTAVYTGSSDAVKFQGANVAYLTDSLEITSGDGDFGLGGWMPTDNSGGEMNDNVPAGDFTYTMEIDSVVDYLSCGMDFSLADQTSGNIWMRYQQWGGVFDVTVGRGSDSGSDVTVNGTTDPDLTTGPVTLRMVRASNVLTTSYDAGSGWQTVTSVDLTSHPSYGDADVSGDDMGFGFWDWDYGATYEVNEFLVSGPTIPSVNTGAEGEGEGEGEGDVLVLLDFEGSDTYSENWDSTTVTETSDAPAGSTTSATLTTDNEIVRYWSPGLDGSDYSYLNMYLKFSADPGTESGCWLGIESDDNGNGVGIWIGPVSDIPGFVAGEWFYVSLPYTDMDPEEWGTGWDYSYIDSVVLWFEGGPIDVSVDYVTLSTTSEAGMLAGGAEGEGEGELSPPVTNGAPVAGMIGLGLVAAVCALGGATALRRSK